MSGDNIASNGDFRGDFSRDTFDPMKHFSRVLMQQGRVQLDADWNEQVSILLHYMRQLGRDLMGPHGAPKGDDSEEGTGFQITADRTLDFSIGQGSYYIGGILCDNGEVGLTYSAQPNYPFTEKEKEKLFPSADRTTKEYLVYLDVWERHLTYVEDDYIREKALGGPDTASRAQIVWQVKVIPNTNISQQSTYNNFKDALKEAKVTQPGTGKLKARAKKTSEGNTNPCLTAPEASYRGVENQLYRVEIHNSSSDTNGPTFKWSRENGSVIFPITNIGKDQITLEHLGRDDRFGLQPGDWVEVLDDDVILRNEANPLLKVTAVDCETLQVTLEGTTAVTGNSEKHPYLRRWDQKKEGGVIHIREGNEEPDWIDLEYGIQIQFLKTDPAAVYQTGDYWLIPARTTTGDVEWPRTADDNPDAVLPHGVVHHYAPLAIINVNGDKVSVPKDGDLRRQLQQGWIA